MEDMSEWGWTEVQIYKEERKNKSNGECKGDIIHPTSTYIITKRTYEEYMYKGIVKGRKSERQKIGKI